MSTNTKGEEIVFHTRTGAKYHREWCSYLRSSYSIALKDAVKRYSPCSRCDPPRFSVKTDNSSLDSCESTRNDSKQSAFRSARIFDHSEDKSKKEKNPFSNLFGDISAITLNHSSSAFNNFNKSNPFSRTENNISEIRVMGNPFLLRNSENKNVSKDGNNSDKDKEGFNNAWRIVKIKRASENNNSSKIGDNTDNNNLIILNNDDTEKNNAFIINTTDKLNENAEAKLNNINNINSNTESKQIKNAEMVANVTEISSSEEALVSKIKAIVEQKFAERESKLNAELEKLRKKTDLQEIQIKSLEEKNLEFQVEIASLKRNSNNNNNQIIEIKSSPSYPKSQAANRSKNTKKINQKESEEFLKITNETQFDILSSDFTNKQKDEIIQIKGESGIKQMENSLLHALDKIAKIEQALDFQSDVNKIHNEKLNFLLSERILTKTKIGNIDDSLDNFMDMIARIKNDLKEEARYGVDFKLGVLKREIEQMREIQIYHNYMLNLKDNCFNDYANFRKDVNEKFTMGSYYMYNDRDYLEDRFGRAKSFVVSNAMVKDFYRKATLADKN